MRVNRKVTGIDFDGGYPEYMTAPATAMAAIPDVFDEDGSFKDEAIRKRLEQFLNGFVKFVQDALSG